jgi:hypothetical protein
MVAGMRLSVSFVCEGREVASGKEESFVKGWWMFVEDPQRNLRYLL